MKSIVIAILGLVAAAQTPAGAPPALYLSNAELMTALKAAAPAAPDMHTAPVKNAGITHQRGPARSAGRSRMRASWRHHIIDGSGTLRPAA